MGGPDDNAGRNQIEGPYAAQCHGSNVGPMGHLRSGNGHVTGGVPFVVGDPRRHDDRHRGWEKPQTIHPTLGDTNPQTVALDTYNQRTSDLSPTLRDPNGTFGDALPAVTTTVPRRLTPTECERLQGFPDGWTRYAHDGTELADSPRYRMLGNAVTVNVTEWIGRRLAPIHTESGNG